MQTYGGSPTVLAEGKLATFMKNATDSIAARAWAANAKLTRWVGRISGSWSQQSENFAKLPLHLGMVSPKTLSTLQRVIIDAPIATFEAEDHAVGYCFNPNGNVVKNIFDGGFRFRQLGRQQCAAIAGAIRELAPVVSAQLGTGWRVINVKSWSIQSKTVQEGPNAWHYDGFPISTFKLMIYLTPVGVQTGTTEVKFDDGRSQLLEGEAGTYMLFDPSTLLHRGVAPTDTSKDRVHIEITLMRAIRTDFHLVFGGLNSAYPRFPWVSLPRLQEGI